MADDVTREWWMGPEPRGSWLRRRVDYTAPFRRRFGTWRGLRIAMELRRQWSGSSAVVPVHVPGWSRPLWLRPGTTDEWVFRQQVLAGELDFTLDPAPRTIIDAGANIGLASRVFAAHWPGARIVAVEMEPGNVEALRRNCDGIGAIDVVQAALWSETGDVTISDAKYGEVGFRVEQGGEVKVPALTVDAIADARGWDTIDLVKLDIEGAEREVLASAHRWLPRVRCLAVELHERFAPGAEAVFARAIDPAAWDIHRHGEYLVAVRRDGGVRFTAAPHTEARDP